MLNMREGREFHCIHSSTQSYTKLTWGKDPSATKTQPQREQTETSSQERAGYLFQVGLSVSVFACTLLPSFSPLSAMQACYNEYLKWLQTFLETDLWRLSPFKGYSMCVHMREEAHNGQKEGESCLCNYLKWNRASTFIDVRLVFHPQVEIARPLRNSPSYPGTASALLLRSPPVYMQDPAGHSEVWLKLEHIHLNPPACQH